MESPILLQHWAQLPAVLAEHIFSSLPSNDIACTIRLVNKAGAARFSSPEHTTIHLSQPVPAHAFSKHWTNPNLLGNMTYAQRLQLLCLTARSGSLPNLAVAAASAGCILNAEVINAAAAAGQVHCCEWLRSQGCRLGKVLSAAAGAGQRRTCEWALAKGCEWDIEAFHAATSGGHEAIMFWLLGLRPEESLRPSKWSLLSVAAGCSLATLKRLYMAWAAEEDLAEAAEDEPQWAAELLAAAGGSRTPDWQAKVEWLVEQGLEVTADSYIHRDAALHPDALGRVQWLLQMGFACVELAVLQAARLGKVDVLEYVHDEGIVFEDTWIDCGREAAEAGQLATLQLLCSWSVGDGMLNLRAAARAGQLPVVLWLVEQQLGEDVLQECYQLFGCAAGSGNLELLRWLYEHGCVRRDFRYTSFVKEAAAAGNVEALRWLVSIGCRFPATGFDACWAAVRKGDLATMDCLQQLGCPWGDNPDSRGDYVSPDSSSDGYWDSRPGLLFRRCMGLPRPTVILEWLLERGCPVGSWSAAVRRAAQVVARAGWTEDTRELWEWLRQDGGMRSRWWAEEAADEWQDGLEELLSGLNMRL
ncbi:hypothetical protein Agub_g8577 [Astrephomene gubernaculifera]|uniref:Ankyrin repeat domain-containing protein n=1 Tax=Astrephomene gubernaculifera TaxID=47775 RepID=A0AAD3DTN9_9CHLO|nr:hypothetical protein Agub_g8577 [Astrephomene gubernaculifera]